MKSKIAEYVCILWAICSLMLAGGIMDSENYSIVAMFGLSIVCILSAICAVLAYKLLQDRGIIKKYNNDDE